MNRSQLLLPADIQIALVGASRGLHCNAIDHFEVEPPRQRLFTEGYVSVIRRDHPRLPANPTLAAFREERHVVVSAYEAPHAHEELDRLLTAALPSANIALRVPGFVAAAMVAKYTDAVATLPLRVGTMLAEELGLQLVRPPLALPRVPIGLFWYERSHRDPANK